MNWGFYIKQLREESHLTQQELADKSGLKRQRISNIERGIRKNLPEEVISKVAPVFSMTAEELIHFIYGEENNPTLGEDEKEARFIYKYDGTIEQLIDNLEMTILYLKKKLKEQKESDN